MIITCYILFALITYWLWILIHEISHILMADLFFKIKKWKIIPYPHIDEGSFFFARVIYTYNGEMTPKKRAAISLAPRIPNLIAALTLQFAWLLSGIPALIWAIFWMGGLIDLAYGSIGFQERSDLIKASKALKWNPWILRISGWAVALGAGLPILISKISELF